ncbi:hypothetical protein AGMMS49938_15990 [Fibrobacterales bacterium]|nr:hypothetical protein AGMMS49938_15990 [Fibrobacterales bacterium]
MKNLNREIAKNLSKTSVFRAWLILILCALLVVFAFFVRYFILSVWEFEGEKFFACELSLCIEDSKSGDLLLAKTPLDEKILLWQIGKSGDSLTLPTAFDSVKFSIPQKNDTIYLGDLNPFAWDLAAALYRDQNKGEKTSIEISLQSKNGEMPFSSVGRATISGRPVSEREVKFLSNGELRLLELQLQRIFPAQDSIHFKRKLFVGSENMRTEITSFTANESLYYLSCEKIPTNKICYDSRERGFFARSNLKGRVFK